MDKVVVAAPMEKEKQEEKQEEEMSPTLDAEIRALQTYYEGNRVYVVTYYMDNRIMIKMYEKGDRFNSMYHYMGMIEQMA